MGGHIRLVDMGAVKRRANDRLRDKAVSYNSGPDAVPFLCECDDPCCRELVRLTVEAYNARGDRGSLRHPGHEQSGCRSSQAVRAAPARGRKLTGRRPG